MGMTSNKMAEPTNHYEFLQLLHELLEPRVYLETGVESGRTLAFAKTVGIGIDPTPRIEHKLSEFSQVFALPSDEFFAIHDVLSLTSGVPIDLAFVDGLHLFENALKDFMNIETYSHPGTVVCIHDVLPKTVRMASRLPRPDGWTGDVFGLILALREHRPDLFIATIGLPNTGMLVVTNLDSSNLMLHNRFDQIVAQHLACDYGRIHENRDRIFDTVPFSFAIVDYLVANANASRQRIILEGAKRLLSGERRIRLGLSAA